MAYPCSKINAYCLLYCREHATLIVCLFADPLWLYASRSRSSQRAWAYWALISLYTALPSLNVIAYILSETLQVESSQVWLALSTTHKHRLGSAISTSANVAVSPTSVYRQRCQSKGNSVSFEVMSKWSANYLFSLDTKRHWLTRLRNKVKSGMGSPDWHVSMFGIHLPKTRWVYCPGHAAVKGNDRADRLAGTATITGGMRLWRGHRQSDQHWNCFKSNIGKTPERRGGAYISLPDCIYIILNRTELYWTACLVVGIIQSSICPLPSQRDLTSRWGLSKHEHTIMPCISLPSCQDWINECHSFSEILLFNYTLKKNQLSETVVTLSEGEVNRVENRFWAVA